MFRFFRRYQKSFIVVGGVILMFVFTVGDSLTAWMRSREDGAGGRSPNATAVTWDGGKLTEGELDSLAYQRQLVNRFVQMVYRAGLERAAMAGREDLAPRVQPIGLVNERWTRPELEQEVLLTDVLAKRGEKLGIQISDGAITEYINELGRGELGSEDIRAILSAINPSGRAPTADYIYTALRHELLASAVARTYGAGTSTQDMFAAEMPINRWEQWKRVNDRVAIEAAAIDPATSLLDVPQPTDNQLREFYNDHKDRVESMVMLPDGTELPSSEPGFKIPRRVRLQYLRANYEEFVDRYAAEVTDEQVATYYEENKYRFVEADSFEDILSNGTDQEPATDEPATEESEQIVEGEMADESASSDVEESADDASDDTEENAKETTEEIVEDQQPAGDEAGGEEPASNATEEPSVEVEDAIESAKDGGNAASVSVSPFRQVAYQVEEAIAEEESAAISNDLASGDLATDTTSDATTTAELTDENNDGEMVVDVEEEIKYQPLEEVADKIRRNIAEDRFFNEIDGAMQSIVAQLNPAFNRYLGAKLDAEALEQEMPDPPTELVDLSPTAKQYSLELEETGELGILELRDTAVGKSVGDEKYNGIPVWRMMYDPDIDLYEPVLSADIGRFGDRYLVMKTTDEPERVPTFDEIKDQLTRAWKMSEAAKLALEKAKETAKKAQDSGLSLKDYFIDDADITVTRTPTFTQFTEGDVAPTSGRPTYRLAQPSGVQAVGPSFIGEVFKLKEGEVAAIPNFDKSIVYIVRLADEFESPEQLRSDFLEQANFWPGRYEFRNSTAQSARGAALEAMLGDINVDWKRPEVDDATDEDAEAEG